MIAKDLISDVIPLLKTSDTAQTALNWMEIFHVSHLPIVNNVDYLGLISDSDIYDLNMPDEAVGNHKLSLQRPFVRDVAHFCQVLSVAARNKLTVVPVLDESDHFKGSITYNEMISTAASLLSVDQPGGLIVLQMMEYDYSMSRIAQIVESNDAKILWVSVSAKPETRNLEVTIKVNTEDLTSIIKTFERYSYDVMSWMTPNDDLDRFYTDRYNMLMKYLNM